MAEGAGDSERYAGGDDRAVAGGVVVLDHRWSRRLHEIKDGLARNRVPYRWLDLDSSAEAARLLEEVEPAERRFPLLLFPDGSRLAAPSDEEVSQKLGLRQEPDSSFYDLIVVGGGPAGLAAAVYASSEGLRTLVVDREVLGGQAGMSARIENYLGFPEGIGGGELMRRAVEQARKFGTEFLAPREVVELRAEGSYRQVALANGRRVHAHAILIATGATHRRLEVPGVEELTGAGVYYGSSRAEAAACAGEHVHLLGGGNSAGQAALDHARYARRVTILTHGASLRESMSEYLAERIAEAGNIEVRPRSTIVAAAGDDRLEGIRVRDDATGETRDVPATTLFVWIGTVAHTEWLGDELVRDDDGFVLCGTDLARHPDGRRRWPLERPPYLLEASVPGVFVAGDVRSGSVKRVASAAGEGAMTVHFVHQYLRGR